MESVVGGEKEKEWMACLSIPHLLQRLPSDSQLGWVMYDLTGALHRIAIVFSSISGGGVVLEYKEWGKAA